MLLSITEGMVFLSMFFTFYSGEFRCYSLWKLMSERQGIKRGNMERKKNFVFVIDE